MLMLICSFWVASAAGEAEGYDVSLLQLQPKTAAELRSKVSASGAVELDWQDTGCYDMLADSDSTSLYQLKSNGTGLAYPGVVETYDAVESDAVSVGKSRGSDQLADFATSAFGVLLTSSVGALCLSGVGKASALQLALFALSAAGMMGGCSLVILQEAFCSGVGVVVCGFLLGLFVMWGLELMPFEELSVGQLSGEQARRVWILFLSLILHSSGEGLCLGASGAAERPEVGKLVVASLALHNVPEGLAVTMAFMSRGLDWKTSSLLCLVSTSAQPVVMVLVYAGLQGSSAVPIGLSFSAASMLWIVCKDLIPEGFESKAVSTATGLAIVASSAALVFCSDHVAHLYSSQ
jgi:zinc transporter ZupT